MISVEGTPSTWITPREMCTPCFEMPADYLWKMSGHLSLNAVICNLCFMVFPWSCIKQWFKLLNRHWTILLHFFYLNYANTFFLLISVQLLIKVSITFASIFAICIKINIHLKWTITWHWFFFPVFARAQIKIENFITNSLIFNCEVNQNAVNIAT